MRSRRTALLLALVVTAAGAWATPAQAGQRDAGAPATQAVPGGFATYEELFAVQQRMITAADAIKATSDTAGLAGFSAKPERRELWVYWKGAVPASVEQTIQAQRGSVPIRVLPARYSKAELLRVAEALAVQLGVTAVGPLTDGSGLTVSTAGSIDALRGFAAGVPLTARARRPVLASRQNSVAPHYGGAAYIIPTPGGDYFCTTGFAVWQGRIKRMLSAGHCADNGDTVESGGGPVMGTVTGDNNTKDTLLIQTSSAGRIYTEAWNSNTSKPVHMALGAIVDTLVCTSGAMTGEHCKIRIIATDLIINVGYLVHPVVEAVHDDGLVAAGLGDSGGPVVAQDSWGPFGGGDFFLVYAMGTITAIDLGPNGEVPCGNNTAFATECSNTLFYVDIMDSLAHYSASIVKG